MGQSNSVEQNTPISGKANIISLSDMKVQTTDEMLKEDNPNISISILENDEVHEDKEDPIIYTNEMLKYMKEVKYFIDNISKDSLVIYIDGENIAWTKIDKILINIFQDKKYERFNMVSIKIYNHNRKIYNELSEEFLRDILIRKLKKKYFVEYVDVKYTKYKNALDWQLGFDLYDNYNTYMGNYIIITNDADFGNIKERINEKNKEKGINRLCDIIPCSVENKKESNELKKEKKREEKELQQEMIEIKKKNKVKQEKKKEKNKVKQEKKKEKKKVKQEKKKE